MLRAVRIIYICGYMVYIGNDVPSVGVMFKCQCDGNDVYVMLERSVWCLKCVYDVWYMSASGGVDP